MSPASGPCSLPCADRLQKGGFRVTATGWSKARLPPTWLCREIGIVSSFMVARVEDYPVNIEDRFSFQT